MPKASRHSPSASLRKNRYLKKRKDAAGEGDDLDYLGEDSDHSFGEDGNLSEGDSLQRGHKRSRPKPPTPGKPSIEDPDSDYDEIGETKVDRGGNLLGGRQYKVPTFHLPNRGNMLYMFSKDPAALLGFRDSFVFLKKNPKLKKVHITDSEKGHLVQNSMLRSTFRTREVSVVTARSVFKQFGHRVLKKGRRGRDDYYYTGEVDEGDDADSDDDHSKEASDKSNWSPFAVSGRNNLTSRRSAAGAATMAGSTNVGASGGGIGANASAAISASATGPSTAAVLPVLNETNWMLHAALSLRNFNTQLCDYRRDNMSFFDYHTNVHQIPAAKQPLRLLHDMADQKPKKKIKEEHSSASEAGAATLGTSNISSTSHSNAGRGSNGPSATGALGTIPASSAAAAAAVAAAQAAAAAATAAVVDASNITMTPHANAMAPEISTATAAPIAGAASLPSSVARPLQGPGPHQPVGNMAMYYQQMVAAGGRPPMGAVTGFHAQQQMMMQQASNGVFPPNVSMTGNPYQYMHPGGTM
ncbi:chromatin remodelling complex Rsc7/Swp82 subunit-domain-containing protein [Dichotomocladium elegans]|nr:chromatin remodelling complex Rsc7/Swp82 subunit-domain-containing protein [Dichotomocladium elegans]